MIAIRLKGAFEQSGDGPCYRYRIVQQELIADVSIAYLSQFEQINGDPESDHILPEFIVENYRIDQLYQGPGWIGNKWREVQAWSVTDGCEIVVEDVGTFWIASNGDKIVLVNAAEGAREGDLIEALLGPALIMALARHGTFCLHASAVLIDGRVVLFLGESGKGKSTLARWLSAQEDETWRLISDDIVPVKLNDGVLVVLPHFPQLKLSANAQPSTDYPEQLPLVAVYVLDRPSDGVSVESTLLNAQEASLALVRNTVASRLFDADLLVRHLDFCMSAASQIPVRRLDYPLNGSVLPLVWKTVSQQIEGQNS